MYICSESDSWNSLACVFTFSVPSGGPSPAPSSVDHKLCRDERSHTGPFVTLWEVFSGTYTSNGVLVSSDLFLYILNT